MNHSQEKTKQIKQSKSRHPLLLRALLDTLPVMTGYVVLGFGFGLLMKANGYGPLWTIAMSLFVYAGSMQYAAVGLMASGASLLTAALTTLMVNARHLFYGISMIERYRDAGWRKGYLIFALTDETYSLVCRDIEGIEKGERRDYDLLVSLLDHIYWVSGSMLGALAGILIPFDSSGIEFALTALFLTVFVEQWLSKQDHKPALIGVLVTVVSLLIFGSEHFLIPAMIVILPLLCGYREGESV